MTAPADTRESWTCPQCRDTLHVVAGQDHQANHAPFCPGPPGPDRGTGRRALPRQSGRGEQAAR